MWEMGGVFSNCNCFLNQQFINHVVEISASPYRQAPDSLKSSSNASCTNSSVRQNVCR